jgi:hypothetical protein
MHPTANIIALKGACPREREGAPVASSEREIEHAAGGVKKKERRTEERTNEIRQPPLV